MHRIKGYRAKTDQTSYFVALFFGFVILTFPSPHRRNHKSMVIIKGGKAVGGITMRPYFDQGFAEIAFCAITASEQVSTAPHPQT